MIGDRAGASRIEDYDYDLPSELIAQDPPPERGKSRLLVVDRSGREMEDRMFADFPSLLQPGEVLVLNDTKVFPARLTGKKETGGKVEILLTSASEEDPRVWRVLLQPTLKEGQLIILADGSNAFYAGRDLDGVALIRFETEKVEDFARKYGQMPLPPYIKREPKPSDAQSYQTVYAAREGAVAAPTAGLHFTDEILKAIEAAGVLVRRVTLHVGYGTFKPVKDLETHRMHAEAFEVRESVAADINKAREEGRRVWAVGTTSVRTLETCALKGRVLAGAGETDLFLAPPAKFEAVDRLLTNFHLPRSTLLLLLAAFMGEELMRHAYRHAIEKKYRFYSYGDAMAIL